jgi:hypothetical protein
LVNVKSTHISSRLGALPEQGFGKEREKPALLYFDKLLAVERKQAYGGSGTTSLQE